MNEKDHIIETFSEMANRYETLMNSELNRFWGLNYPDFIKELLIDINFKKQQRILDIATGTGFIPQNISKVDDQTRKVFGLDITYEMLFTAKKQLVERNINKPVHLICASAHAMPFQDNAFDITTCCLATHHLDIDMLMKEAFSSLKPGGKFHIADVGASSKWKTGFAKSIIKIAAFVYFLFAENYQRARSEAEAVVNIYTVKEWYEIISTHGFTEIKLRELKSKRFWAPNPVIIEANKPTEEEK